MTIKMNFPGRMAFHRFSMFLAVLVMPAWLLISCPKAEAFNGQVADNVGGADFFYSLEEKTDEFFVAFKNKQFDRLLAMLSGAMKAQFTGFVSAYQKDPVTAGKEIPDRWRILGTGNDPQNGCFSYVNFHFGGGWSKFTFHWLKGQTGWTIDRMQPVQLAKIGTDGKVEDMPLPVASLHLSAAEEAKIQATAGKLIKALQEFAIDDILKLMPEHLREDFDRHMADEKRQQEQWQRYFGTKIRIEAIRPGEEWDSKDGRIARLELAVEHKDGSGDFTSAWELQRIAGQWQVTQMR